MAVGRCSALASAEATGDAVLAPPVQRKKKKKKKKKKIKIDKTRERVCV